MKQTYRRKHRRNDALIDRWSFVHMASGIGLMFLLPNLLPIYAWLGMAAWEPVEILVLSPLLARWGIIFGFETWRNSLSDIVFNTLGICIGLLILYP